MSKGKSLNALMKHIRVCHSIEVEGSRQKQELANMGYYHGYKRYRFIKEAKNKQNLVHFSEIKAIHKFDSDLKSLVYPLITSVETSLKNRTIDFLVTNAEVDIETIYKNRLIGYKDYSNYNEPKKYQKYLKNRLDLRHDIDKTIAYYYGKNKALDHFLHSSRPVPLWVYFELISFGQYGQFVSALNRSDRLSICAQVGLANSALNHDGRLLQEIVFSLTDLRNATMHNAAIFDTHFRSDNISRTVKKFLVQETKIDDIDFNTILDYVFLLLILMKKQGYNKTQLRTYINEFRKIKENFYPKVPKETYGQLLGMNSNQKLQSFEKCL